MHTKSSYCQLQLPWRLQNELYILVAHMRYITEELCAQYIYILPAPANKHESCSWRTRRLEQLVLHSGAQPACMAIGI